MSLVSNSVVNGQLSLFKPAKLKAGKTESVKVAGLANILRDSDIDQKQLIGAPNGTQLPTNQQSNMQRRLGLHYEDRQYGIDGGRLGDYSNVTRQQTNDSLEATRAMNVQTINSMDDLVRIRLANQSYSALAGQMSLNQIEHKAFKKYKKSVYNKLAMQTF